MLVHAAGTGMQLLCPWVLQESMHRHWLLRNAGKGMRCVRSSVNESGRVARLQAVLNCGAVLAVGGAPLRKVGGSGLLAV